MVGGLLVADVLNVHLVDGVEKQLWASVVNSVIVVVSILVIGAVMLSARLWTARFVLRAAMCGGAVTVLALLLPVNIVGVVAVVVGCTFFLTQIVRMIRSVGTPAVHAFG